MNGGVVGAWVVGYWDKYIHTVYMYYTHTRTSWDAQCTKQALEVGKELLKVFLTFIRLGIIMSTFQ